VPAPQWPAGPARGGLRYAARMKCSLRRSSLLLLWLLLALLPLRGWANLTMHLPTQGSASAAPCHGVEMAAAHAAADTADAAPSCTLCDVCHGVMLPAAEMAQGSDRCAQPLPTARPAPAAAAEPDTLFRPPRR
jgi:hypothetical protein